MLRVDAPREPGVTHAAHDFLGVPVVCISVGSIDGIRVLVVGCGVFHAEAAPLALLMGQERFVQSEERSHKRAQQSKRYGSDSGGGGGVLGYEGESWRDSVHSYTPYSPIALIAL